MSQNITNEDFTKVAAFIGNQSAYTDMEGYGYFASYSSLHPRINGDHPDNSFSEVPYEKGFQLLHYIESLIGETNMRELLNEWVLQNTYQSRKWNDFRDKYESFVDENFSSSEARQLKLKVDWVTWVYYAGLAPVYQDFTTSLLNESIALANGYIER